MVGEDHLDRCESSFDSIQPILDTTDAVVQIGITVTISRIASSFESSASCMTSCRRCHSSSMQLLVRVAGGLQLDDRLSMTAHQTLDLLQVGGVVRKDR